MPWSISHDSEIDVIEVTYSGVLSLADVQEAIAKRVALQEETGATSVLADTTGIDRSVISVYDLLDIPDRYFQAKNSTRLTRIALILPQEHKAKKDAEFLETACLNRGWQLKTFKQRSEALEWLRKIDSSNKGIQSDPRSSGR